jgi:F-type H+-transporting ATPase subunit epsilon
VQVEIVTPTGSAYSGEADDLTAPGRMGEFGVFPGHIPFLAALRAGVLRAKRAGTELIFAVGAGYVQVGTGDRIIVLTEACKTPDEIDLAAARKEYEHVTGQLASWDRALDSDWYELDARRAWADAMIEAKTGEFRFGGIGARDAPNMPESPPYPAF